MVQAPGRGAPDAVRHDGLLCACPWNPGKHSQAAAEALPGNEVALAGQAVHAPSPASFLYVPAAQGVQPPESTAGLV